MQNGSSFLKNHGAQRSVECVTSGSNFMVLLEGTLKNRTKAPLNSPYLASLLNQLEPDGSSDKEELIFLRQIAPTENSGGHSKNRDKIRRPPPPPRAATTRVISQTPPGSDTSQRQPLIPEFPTEYIYPNRIKVYQGSIIAQPETVETLLPFLNNI